MGLLLLLLLGDARSILLAQSSADGTGLLCAEVEGQVLLVLVEDAQLRALVDVDDGQDASDGLADIMDSGELALGTTGDLLGAELDELGLQFLELSLELILVLAPEGLGLDLSGRHFRCELVG